MSLQNKELSFQTLNIMKLVLLFVSVPFVFSMNAYAVETQAGSLLIEKLKQINTLEASYRQTVKDSKGQILEESQGYLYLKKGKKFKSVISFPYEQEICLLYTSPSPRDPE